MKEQIIILALVSITIVLCIILARLLTPAIRFSYKLIRFLTWKKYKKNPRKTNLAPDQIKYLAVGAIYAEQHLMYSNTITTGNPKNLTKKILTDHWNTENRESALKTLDNLTQLTHSSYYQFILDLFLNEEESDWLEKIEDKYEESEKRQQCVNFLNNFLEVKDNLMDEDDFLEEDFFRGITAWDMGRLVGVARMACDMGYISQPEALEKVYHAYDQCCNVFSSWEQLAKSYLLGLNIWGGRDGHQQGIKLIIGHLLNEEESPWNTYQFV